MFAPRVAQSQNKAVERPNNNREGQQSKPLAIRSDLNLIEDSQLLQRTDGNEATMRLLAPDGGNSAPNEPSEPPSRLGLSWNFAGIAVFPPGHAERPQQAFPLAAAPFGVIQPKLEIGAVNDPLEREADEFAERVMRMPGPAATTNSATPGSSSAPQTESLAASDAHSEYEAGYPTLSGSTSAVQLKCSCEGSCEKCKTEQSDDDQGKVQRKPAAPQISAVSSSSSATGIEAPPIVHEVLRSPGKPLDPATRAFFESRFGRDFGEVRVHTDTSAEQSARDVNANAYTVGRNMVFDTGRFVPNTSEGRRLLHMS